MTYPGGGLAFTPLVCAARLYRCCGEGMLRCEKPPGHHGFHAAQDGDVVTEW